MSTVKFAQWAHPTGGSSLSVDASGNFGIGVTPTAKLHVGGSAAATVSALTDGATITPNFATSNNFSVTLAGNRTLANPTSPTVGQSGVIAITQDATGGRTLAYGANWDFSGGTAPTISTAANSVNLLAYYVRTSTSIVAQVITGAA